jgi:predicted DNA-binding transcriptional regulator AlpA
VGLTLLAGVFDSIATVSRDIGADRVGDSLAATSEAGRILGRLGAIMSASNENDPPNLTIAQPLATAEELIDEPTLATRLGVSRSTLQSWRYGGRGPRFIKLGRMIRYRTADIEAYLRANTRGKVA